MGAGATGARDLSSIAERPGLAGSLVVQGTGRTGDGYPSCCGTSPPPGPPAAVSGSEQIARPQDDGDDGDDARCS